MYGKYVNPKKYSVSIEGYQFICEELTANESFNRRETNRHNLLGGTQSVVRTNYIVRDYTFVTHVLIDPSYPNVYDSIFSLWMSKPVEVISKDMGGKFNAEVIIKKTRESVNYLKLEIQVIEIPNKSKIPNEKLNVPSDKVVTVVSKDKNGKIIKTNEKKKLLLSSNKKKNSSKKKRKKGSNITKVK